MHDKNFNRVESIKEGKYFTFNSPALAKIYIQGTLNDLLMNRLR